MSKRNQKTGTAEGDEPNQSPEAITICVSSGALFNTDKERQIYEEKGLEEYVKYNEKHDDTPFPRGVAFSFVKAVMTVNSRLRELYPDSKELFDIVIMTSKHAKVGKRLKNSIIEYDLIIDRFFMTGSESAVGFMKANKTNLYLSKDPNKVKEAIKEGIAAATMFNCDNENELSDTPLRVAFDGDAVLFSDESEIVMKTQGLKKYIEHEKKNEGQLIGEGPLKIFLKALVKLQQKFLDKVKPSDCPIRTYLVTSRGATSGEVRVLKTLTEWGLEIDSAMFLAGADKGPILKNIGPHIFFDDQMKHIEGARRLGTVAAHVPYGIANQI